MPPRKTKTRGKKRRSGTKGKKYPKTFKRLMEKMYRGTQKRGRAAARYARRNPGRIAGGLAGAGALGLAGYEGYLAARRGTNFIPGMESDAYASPTGRAFRRGRRGVTAARDYFNDPNRDDAMKIAMETNHKVIPIPEPGCACGSADSGG